MVFPSVSEPELRHFLEEHGGVILCAAFVIFCPLLLFFGMATSRWIMTLPAFLLGMWLGVCIASGTPGGMSTWESAVTLVASGGATAVLVASNPHPTHFTFAAVACALASNLAYIAAVARLDYHKDGTQVALVVGFSLVVAAALVLLERPIMKVTSSFIGGYMAVAAINYILARLSGPGKVTASMWPANFIHQEHHLRKQDVLYMPLLVAWLVLFLVGFTFQSFQKENWGRNRRRERSRVQLEHAEDDGGYPYNPYMRLPS